MIQKYSKLKQEITPSGLALCAWGLANISHYDKRLMNIIKMMVITSLQSGSQFWCSQDVSMIFHAFSTFYNKENRHEIEQMLDLLIQLGTQGIEEFTVQGLANVAWALAVTGKLDQEIFEKIREEITAGILPVYLPIPKLSKGIEI
eukprot:TRINITY_DN24442_c0_g1_i3.p2 TRINITY_DN24442_c0_g1~~TRINITY_DN24442_c0_g1_i3.p2  ORF type:complete len:146 (+),score=20.43 TRINITY_DN24442_c0_g1_i3:271-708(+)